MRSDLLAARQRVLRMRDQQQFFLQNWERHQVRFLDGQSEQTKVDGAGTDFRDELLAGPPCYVDFDVGMRSAEFLEQSGKDIQADGHTTHQTQRPCERVLALADER